MSLLDAIQKRLEKEISYAAITEVEDLFHEEDNRVVRAFTFSRVTRETIAVIGEDGYLYYYGHPKKGWRKSCCQISSEHFFYTLKKLSGTTIMMNESIVVVIMNNSIPLLLVFIVDFIDFASPLHK